MLLGMDAELSINLNHEWLWDNTGKKRAAQCASEHLPEVRSLILAGDYEQGTKLTNDYFSIRPNAVKRGCYLSAGQITVNADYGEISDYNRRLFLKRGYAEINFNSEKYGKVKQTVFVSVTDNVGCIKIETEKTAVIKLGLCAAEGAEGKCTFSPEQSRIKLSGGFPETMEYAVELNLQGEYEISGNSAVVSTKELFVQFNIGTNAKGNTPENELVFSQYDFETLFRRQTERFEELMSVTELELSGSITSEDTSERCRLFKEGKDNTLPVLFFNLGKYIYASEELSELPLNLQGKWNEEISPPWKCGYHFDINLQMNYWAAPVLNFNRQILPLFNYLESCVESGREAARNLFGCNGIYMSLCGDAYAKMAPEAYGWDVWIGGAPWFAAHFMDYYDYTRDEQFLKERAYPFIKEVASFITSYVIESEKEAVIVPSCSPENRFIGAGDLPISMCKNSAMDLQLFNETLYNAIRCAEILQVDTEERKVWKQLRDKLPCTSVGKDGRIVEWDCEHEEWEPEHRHVSHLYGMYPGNLKACKGASRESYYTSLKYRLSFGGGQTGWSRGWATCLMARMGKADEAFLSLKNLIIEQCSSSLLDLHPPFVGRKKPIFQIDGNLGGTAAVCEMLLSCEEGKISLLHALPEEWQSGSFKGFKAKGNIVVDCEWKNGKLIRAILSSPIKQTVKITVSGSKEILCELNGINDVLIDGSTIEYK